MSDNVPPSPTWSTWSTHVAWDRMSLYGSFGEFPFEEEEDVLFPYWETREHDLFEEEAVHLVHAAPTPPPPTKNFLLI